MNSILYSVVLSLFLAANCLASPEYSATIKNMPVMNIAYAEHIGDYDNDPGIYEKLLSKLIGWALPKGLFEFPEKTKLITILPDEMNDTADGKKRLQIAITVPDDVKIFDGIKYGSIPGGQYAVGSFVVTDEEFEECWELMFEEWLPQSGYAPLEGAALLQIHKNDPEKHPQKKNEIDICIPVQRESRSGNDDSITSILETGLSIIQMFL